jgi:hypothetical protein
MEQSDGQEEGGKEKNECIPVKEFECVVPGLRRTKTLNNLDINLVKNLNLFDEKMKDALMRE